MFKLDEFLIAIGLKADTKPAEKMADAIDDVADSAKKADAQVESFGSRLSKALGSALTIVSASAVAIKTALLGAWAFFDSYISKAEELYNSKNADLKITKEQLEQSKKYEEGLGKLGKIIESVKVKVAFGFLPTMLRMVETFNKFLDANKDLIANGIGRFLSIISGASQLISSFIRFIELAVTSTIGWEKALYVLAAAFIFIKRAMLLAFITNPIFWIIAAIGVLLILIDDFMTYLDGGESEFGEFWGAMLGWIDKAKKAWSEFSEDAKSAIKALIVALGLLASSGIIVKTMTVVFAILGKTIGFVLSPVRLLIGLTGTLAKAFLLLGKVILANPMILVVALIAAVGYAIYDLIKWLKTGESAFGGFWQVVANIWNLIVANVTSAINKMVDAISSFISRIGAIFSNVFAVITTPFRLAFDWIMDKFSKLPSLIGNIISKLPGVNAISAIGSAVSSGVSRVTNNYGGNTTASINVTAPNATSAANQTAAALQGAQAQRNLGGQALA